MLNIQALVTQAQLGAKIWSRKSTAAFIAKYPDATSAQVFTGLANNQSRTRTGGYSSIPTVKVEVHICSWELSDIDITDFATVADSEGLSAEIIMEDRVIRGVRHLAILSITSRYTAEQRQLLEGLGKLRTNTQKAYTYKALAC